MNMSQTILLIGLRGSGKSTLGRLLAIARGVSFVDLDDLTLRRMGYSTVSEAWTERGERAFRASEIEALTGAIEDGGVIALGGGTPMAPGGEDLITSTNTVSVYLRGDPALLRDRLEDGAGADRPSLTGADPIDEIERVFKDRDETYRVIADHVLELAAHEQPDQTLLRLIGMIG